MKIVISALTVLAVGGFVTIVRILCRSYLSGRKKYRRS